MKFAGLAVGMVLLMATMRGLMEAARDPLQVIAWAVLLVPLGHGLFGGATALLAWRRLARVSSAPAAGDLTARADLVAKQIQQQTELRLAVGLGIGLVMLGAATVVAPAPGVVAVYLLVVLTELTLVAILVTNRALLWAALAGLTAVTMVWGFCIWAAIQMIRLD
jgi:hypothetical protein